MVSAVTNMAHHEVIVVLLLAILVIRDCVCSVHGGVGRGRVHCLDDPGEDCRTMWDADRGCRSGMEIGDGDPGSHDVGSDPLSHGYAEPRHV